MYYQFYALPVSMRNYILFFLNSVFIQLSLIFSLSCHKFFFSFKFYHPLIHRVLVLLYYFFFLTRRLLRS